MPPNIGETPTGLPLDLTPAQRSAGIMASLRKAVMGRAESARDVARVADEVGPLVADACAQPDAQPIFDRMSQDTGLTPDEAREKWARLQEADILLESGGDPEAVSSAGAVGVSQWMPGTGAHGTLAIDQRASAALTSQIEPLKWKVAWLKYWEAPTPPLTGPPPAGVPKLTAAQAAQKLPPMEAKLAALRAKRRAVDARYDPPKAILAQTRYLLNLYDRFPSPDWLFQAYHGGEAGVDRLLMRYLGPQWPGTSETAIRSGNAGGRLTFEDVYLSVSPRSHPDAFSYLYGRGDDHRHYWWKLRVAQEAIALYRQNRSAFQRQWLQLGPGYSTDAVWYTLASRTPFRRLAELQRARAAGDLAQVRDTPLWIVRPAPFDKSNAETYNSLRPASRGALYMLASAYRQAGGVSRLVLGDCALTEDYVAVKRARFAAPPAKYPMPPDPEISRVIRPDPAMRADYHTIGVPFDILHPADRTQRKVLEYALGYFKDRGIMAWREENTGTEPKHYHVVPNPAFSEEFKKISPGGPLDLPGL